MAKKKGNRNKGNNLGLDLSFISPLTETQQEVFSSEKNMVLCGTAGSGKTFLSCYLGLQEIAAGEYDSLTIIRSAVPTRNIGFMPGNDAEKARVYEEPYYAILSELYHRGDAYDILKRKGIVDFMTTSYIRGLTLKRSYIIVDEIQNMSYGELDSLITRVGSGCRIVFCGDFKQADLKANGMEPFLKILTAMEDSFDVFNFGIEDVVRSPFVKDYLRTKDRLGL